MLARLTFDRLVTLLFFVTIFSLACVMPAQNDTWWHLRAGEETWRHGGVVLRDVFSHTVYGTYWPDLEWLSEAVFYALHRAGGMPLLTAFTALVATSTWVVVWRLIPGSPMLRLLLAAFAAVPISTAWSVRPHLLSLFMLSLTALCIERRRLWPIPLLFLLWANLHGGFGLGLVCLAAATLWALVNARDQLGRFAAATVAGALATNVTPLGFSEWLVIGASMQRIRQYPISEWRAPGLATPIYWPFWGVAAALVVLAIARRVRREPAPEGPLVWSALAVLPLAMTASRNVAPFMLLATPALASLVDPRVFRRTSPHRRRPPLVNAALLGSGVTLGVVAIAYAWSAQIPRLGWNPLPSDAIAAVERCPGNLYNRWDEGGFLVWFTPDQKVFIDGRQDPYPPALVAEHMRVEESGDYKGLFQRYDIRCAFLPETSPVARRLRDDGWRALYRDGHWIVFAQP